MEDRNTSFDENSIDLVRLLKLFWSKKVLIICLMVVLGLGMFVKTYYFTSNTYTSSGVLYVSNKKEVIDDTAIQKSDIDTARELSTTYIEILKTSHFLDEVAKQVNENYNYKHIQNLISIDSVNKTELLKVTVTSTSATDAYYITKTILEKAPAKLTSIYKSGEVEIVDPPRKPHKPDGKGTVKNTLLGAMLGAVIGCAIVFLCDFFDKKVHQISDVIKKYGVSVLGELSNQTMQNSKARFGKKVVAEGSQNILNRKSSFDTVETYKAIRTNIMFSIPKDNKGKIIVVTSSAPNEGKTTASINLAITFSQVNAKVLLIDCDLRKSRIHRYLKIEKGEGLSNVLCGFCETESAIRRDIRENLDVMTAGEIPSNPAELLESDEFERVLRDLQNEYDYIFIDTPPMTIVTDASVIMQKSHGVAVVIRENVTTFDLLDETFESIWASKAKVLGVIALDSSQKQKRYGYYKNGKQKYRYGYKYKYKYDYRYDDKDEN